MIPGITAKQNNLQGRQGPRNGYPDGQKKIEVI